ncbi:MAG: hypothetical protein R3E83_11035 [Burkholderiaceae bacterium]
MTATPDAQSRPAGADWLGALIVFGPLLLTTFGAKLAAPAGPPDIPLSFYGILALFALGLATRRLVVDTDRLLVFSLMLAVLGALQVLRPGPWSAPSLLMMATLYACYVVGMPAGAFDQQRALRLFLNVTSVIAIAGILQFFAQFVIGPQLAFPVDYLLPDRLLVDGYMNLNVLSYGSSTHKANGVFLLEASFFSQLLAMAVLAELVSHNRLHRLAIYAMGMMVAYSGTGILILLATLPVLALTQRRGDMVLLGVIGLLTAIVLYEPLNLELFVKRATEFKSTQSSGFERFVGAAYFFDQFLWTDTARSLFGVGAGMMKAFEGRAHLPVHESALTKIIFEYGLIGALLNIGFLFFCLARTHAPPVLKLGVAVMFFMAGIYTPSSHGIALSLMFWPSPGGEPLRLRRPLPELMMRLGLHPKRKLGGHPQ